MRAAGVSDDVVGGLLEACFDSYIGHLKALIADGQRVRVMPGIAEVLSGLSSHPTALVGLLTGNIERGARVKLGPTGLLPYFRVGAFGSDHADRRRLPIIARRRACELVQQDIPFESIHVIGDTPLDIDCARACGARAIAVATGQHGTDELAAHGPDLLFTDFSHSDAVVLALTRE
jgi:phosphoglycolate phosphatase-like HAD superfamily hydrolase